MFNLILASSFTEQNMPKLKIVPLYALCGITIIIVMLVILHDELYPGKAVSSTKNYVPLEYRDELITKRPFRIQLPRAKGGYLINNQGCRIKDLHPEDKSVMETLTNQHEAELQGNYSRVHTVSYVLKSHLHINQTELHSFARKEQINPSKISCCYRPILRGLGKSADKYIRFDKNCFAFRKTVKVRVEVFQVECYFQKRMIYKYSHAIVQVKPHVEKRCEMTEHMFPSHDQHLSVLIVGVDGTSRQNFHRFMKKSRDILAKHSALEVFGYTSVGENTLPNLIPLLTGLSSKELLREPCYANRSGTFDSCNFLWNVFSSNGFRTAYIEDEPRFNLFSSRGGFMRPPTDYYFRSMYLANLNGTYSKLQYPNSKILETEETLSLTSNLVKMLHDKKYFIFTWLNALTHGNMFNAPVLDEIFHKFLSNLISKNRLKNTLLILMSDHGVRYGSFRQTAYGWSEAKRPLLYLLFPNWFFDKYPCLKKNLYHSSSNLITNYDVHETLKALLFHEYYRQHPGQYVDEYEGILTALKAPPHHKLYWAIKLKGISMFRMFPKDRTCTQASIPLIYCPCYAMHQVSHQSDFVPAAVKALILKVNSVTKAVRKVCVNLTVKALINVRIMVPNDSSDQYNVQLGKKQALSETRYMILFSTLPGDAVFEGIFELNPATKNPKNVDVLRVSKINFSHTSCVKKPRHKLHCYCRKPKIRDLS